MCKYRLLARACQHRLAVLVGFCEQAPLVGAGGQPPCRSLRRSASLPCSLTSVAGLAPLKPSAEEIATMLPSLSLRKMPGLRGTDESSTLYSSNTIMQHIAESVRNCTSEQQVVALLDCESELSDIEADCNSIKEEVQALRKLAHDPRELNTPADEYLSQRSGAISTAHSGSRLASPVRHGETPAQAVKRRIEANAAAEASKIPSPVKQPSLPKASDFPPFGNAKMNSTPSSDGMRSYVGALTANLKGAGGKKPQGDSMRFARPTEATVRRTDQTLRSNAAGPEMSPTKSAKGMPPSFETEKRAEQRQKKQRPALPNSWANESPEKKERGSPSTPMTPPSGNRTPKQAAVANRKSMPPYMSPTKSTRLRQNVVNSSQSSSKQSTPCVKAAGLRLDTTNQGPKASEVQSASSATDFAITSGSSDDVFRSPSTQAIARASMMSSRLSSMSQELTSLAHGRSSTLPSPLPEVANTAIRRTSKHAGMLEPVLNKLAVSGLLKGQPIPQADETAPRRQSRHQKSASHSGEYWPETASRPADLTGYVSQQSYAGGPAAAQSSFFQTQQTHTVGPGNDQTGGFLQQRMLNPFGLNLNDTKPVREKRPSRYGRPFHEGIGGLKSLFSKQVGEAMALAQDATPTRKLSFSGLAAQDPAILYQGRMPSTGFAPPEVDPAILYSGSVRGQIAGSTTAATSNLDATAPDFKPSWLPSTPPPLEVASFSAPHVTGNPGDEAPVIVHGQDSSQASRALHDGLLPVGLMSGGLATPQASMATPPAVSFQGFNQDMHPHQTRYMSSAFYGTPAPLATEESFSTPAASPWHIRGESDRQYLWSGSDGREIMYQGYGPDAEYDPNSPVSFFSASTKKRIIHRRPATMRSDENQENQSPMPPTAPKKMREQSLLQDQNRIPCGVTDFIVNTETCFPWVIPEPGSCYNCKNKHGWTGVYGTDAPIGFF